MVFDRLGEDAWRAAQGSEAIIYKYSWNAGYSIAEKLGIPCAGVMFFPLTRTREFPSFLLGEGKDRGPLLNSLLWRLSEQVIVWQYQRQADNKLRRETLGLKPLPFFGPFARQDRQGMPVFYTYSQSLLPRPVDWPERIHVTGFWYSEPPQGWQSQSDLLKFLQNGSPPVYIGFGSMPSQNAKETLQMILKALEISHQRGIILSGWANLGKGSQLPESVFSVRASPMIGFFRKWPQ